FDLAVMLVGPITALQPATIKVAADLAILLDVGASGACRPQHLVEFTVMGTVYARVAPGIQAPRIGLLSIGEEAVAYRFAAPDFLGPIRTKIAAARGPELAGRREAPA